MSNPYLTMYGYDESGDSMEHAWLNKAKEKEYNHQYYLRNRNRLLAEKRKMRGPSTDTSGRNNLQSQADTMYDRYRQASYDRQRQEHANRSYFRNFNGSPEERAAQAYKRKAVLDVTRGHESRNKEAYEKLQGQVDALKRKQSVAQGQAQNAYNEAVARQRKAIRDNAQAESRAKIAEANTLPNRLKREARKLSYKVGAPIDRAARKLKDKATEVMGKAKAAYEKARNQLRALRGAGGAGAVAGNAVYKAKQAALNRAKELYQKAKDKVKKYASDAYNKITGRNS